MTLDFENEQYVDYLKGKRGEERKERDGEEEEEEKKKEEEEGRGRGGGEGKFHTVSFHSDA